MRKAHGQKSTDRGYPLDARPQSVEGLDQGGGAAIAQA